MKQFIPVLMTLLLFLLPTEGFAVLGDYFVDSSWLVTNRAKVVVVDVRSASKYQLRHVEGAYHVDRSQFLQSRNGVPNMVSDSPAISELLSSLGITPEKGVVVYAEDDNPFAARLVWTLHYYGLKNVFVLDGGYDQWNAEHHPVSESPTANPVPSHFALTAAAVNLENRADADYIYTRLDNPDLVVWDARSPGEYAGTDVRADRGGHIPGAVSLNWMNLLTERNGVKVLKSREEILTLLKEHGITSGKMVVAHCQTGVRSAYATLVLLGLGYDKVKNYDGSWIEWANNRTLPIVNPNGKIERLAEP